MKKNFAITAALAAMFAMPALSMGAAQVWFTLASGDVTESSSGAGQTLELVRGDAAQVYDFTVTMWANVTGIGVFGANTSMIADGPIVATSATLNGPPNGLPTSITGYRNSTWCQANSTGNRRTRQAIHAYSPTR